MKTASIATLKPRDEFATLYPPKRYTLVGIDPGFDRWRVAVDEHGLTARFHVTAMVQHIPR